MFSPANWADALASKLGQQPLEFAGLYTHSVSTGSYCEMHRHPTLEIVHHPAGRGRTCLPDGQTHEFESGGTVIYAPEQPHDQFVNSAGLDVCIHVAVPPEWQGVLPRCAALRGTARRLIQADMDFLAEFAGTRAAAGSHWRAMLNLRATTLLLTLISELQDAPPLPLTPAARHAAEAERFIREHFARLESVDEVAAAIGVSPSHLRQLFRAERGQSPGNFLRQVRLSHARHLLRSTRLPLKQVASACGFRDEYYFSAVFTAEAGTPPGAFRHSG